MAFEYHSVRGHAFLLLWFFVYGLAPLAECELIEGRILRPLSWGRSNSMSKENAVFGGMVGSSAQLSYIRAKSCKKGGQAAFPLLLRCLLCGLLGTRR